MFAKYALKFDFFLVQSNVFLIFSIFFSEFRVILYCSVDALTCVTLRLDLFAT